MIQDLNTIFKELSPNTLGVILVKPCQSDTVWGRVFERLGQSVQTRLARLDHLSGRTFQSVQALRSTNKDVVLTPYSWTMVAHDHIEMGAYRAKDTCDFLPLGLPVLSACAETFLKTVDPRTIQDGETVLVNAASCHERLWMHHTLGQKPLEGDFGQEVVLHRQHHLLALVSFQHGHKPKLWAKRSVIEC